MIRATITDTEILKSIRPSTFVSYLKEKGWEEVYEKKESLKLTFYYFI